MVVKFLNKNDTALTKTDKTTGIKINFIQPVRFPCQMYTNLTFFQRKALSQSQQHPRMKDTFTMIAFSINFAKMNSKYDYILKEKCAYH